MHKDSIEAMLIAVVGLRLWRDGGQGRPGGCGGVRVAGTAVWGLYKTLGALVFLLQQRETGLRLVEETPKLGCDGDGDGENESEGNVGLGDTY